MNQPVVIKSIGARRVSMGAIPQYVSAPVNSYSVRAAQANTPPQNRAPAAMHADSNLAVCRSSSSRTAIRSQGTDPSPSDSGPSPSESEERGSVPPFNSKKSIQARTSG